MREILEYLIANFGILGDAEQLFVLKHCKKRELRAGDVLLKVGETCDHVWFVEKGMLAAIQTEPEKPEDPDYICKDYLNWMMIENDVATGVPSFFKQRPSLEKIVAIEESIVWEMSRKDLFEGVGAHHSLNFVTMMVILKYYEDTRLYETCLRMKRPELIFQYLRDLDSPLLLRLTDKMLMSFLGVTGPTLAKIKAATNNPKAAGNPKLKKKK
jgi:CRP-like cAMP-binding protein